MNSLFTNSSEGSDSSGLLEDRSSPRSVLISSSSSVIIKRTGFYNPRTYLLKARFNVKCKQHNKTVLSPKLILTKTGEIDGTCKRSLNNNYFSSIKFKSICWHVAFLACTICFLIDVILNKKVIFLPSFQK